jgi:hypothetical protein
MQTDSITAPPPTATPRKCDATIKHGRRFGKTCGAPATLYDAKNQRNSCGVHRRPLSVPGTGPSWFEVES